MTGSALQNHRLPVGGVSRQKKSRKSCRPWCSLRRPLWAGRLLPGRWHSAGPAAPTETSTRPEAQAVPAAGAFGFRARLGSNRHRGCGSTSLMPISHTSTDLGSTSSPDGQASTKSLSAPLARGPSRSSIWAAAVASSRCRPPSAIRRASFSVSKVLWASAMAQRASRARRTRSSGRRPCRRTSAGSRSWSFPTVSWHPRCGIIAGSATLPISVTPSRTSSCRSPSYITSIMCPPSSTRRPASTN
mmetsp:Transcript_6886/g.17231  ORF Transcript_6886/g.17231 Transcript_6886/m.17231 type:complete len:245 (+) Transcript_6886:511-1245(+)